jgi:hypothetical protein
MAIKAVLYRLLPDGTQPYTLLEPYNIVFNGWLAEKNGVYLWIATGELSDMQAFAQSNTDFQFQVVNKTQAVNFYISCLPAVIEYPPQPTKQDMIDSLSAMIP